MIITTVCVQIDNCFRNTSVVCPSVYVVKVISGHAFVSPLEMFSKMKRNLSIIIDANNGSLSLAIS